MNTRFKVFASYNILQNLCDFIHVLIFVTVSKCQKSPKLTNIVIVIQASNVDPIGSDDVIVQAWNLDPIVSGDVILIKLSTDLSGSELRM